jgi:hypothetical protein
MSKNNIKRYIDEALAITIKQSTQPREEKKRRNKRERTPSPSSKGQNPKCVTKGAKDTYVNPRGSIYEVKF